jgi:hypothetical protein
VLGTLSVVDKAKKYNGNGTNNRQQKPSHKQDGPVTTTAESRGQRRNGGDGMEKSTMSIGIVVVELIFYICVGG